MREIKFRVWDKHDGYWVESFMVGKDGAVMDIYAEEYLESFHLDRKNNNRPVYEGNIVLMQYTGLKDKNGVEIYEGDIITYYGKVNAMTFGNQMQTVRWDAHRCGFFPMTQWYAQRDDGVEVIGNIYENPELLK